MVDFCSDYSVPLDYFFLFVDLARQLPPSSRFSLRRSLSNFSFQLAGKEQLYRAPAIRALCKIADAGTLQAVERYMKQAIVDKNGSVASGALVSCLHLLNQGCADIVRRWPNEVQEALNSDDPMVCIEAVSFNAFHSLCQ